MLVKGAPGVKASTFMVLTQGGISAIDLVLPEHGLSNHVRADTPFSMTSTAIKKHRLYIAWYN